MAKLNISDFESKYNIGQPVVITWSKEVKFEDPKIKGWTKRTTATVLLGTDNDTKEYFINKFIDENQLMIDEIIDKDPAIRKKLDDAKSVKELKALLNIPDGTYRAPIFQKYHDVFLQNASTGELFLAVDMDYTIETNQAVITVYKSPDGTYVREESDLPSKIKKRLDPSGPHYTFPLSLAKLDQLVVNGLQFVY